MRAISLSPELIYVAAAAAYHPALQGDPPPIPRDLEAARLTALTERHRVTPALARTLREANLPIPAKLHERAIHTTVRALHHASALCTLCESLEQHEIEALPLKGAVLSWQIFGDIGLREVRDIDIIVKPEALLEADHCVRSLGYRRLFPKSDPTPRRLRAILAQEQDFEYRHTVTGIPLDLHWRIRHWTPTQLDWLWSTTTIAPWPAGQIRQLSLPAQLLFVADHAAQHHWFRLKWLADFLMLARIFKPEDLNEIAAYARELDLIRPLAQGLQLAQQIDPQLPTLPDELPAALTETAIQSIAATEPIYQANNRNLGWFRNRTYCRNLRTNPNPKSQPTLLRPRDFDQLPLPDALFWLYYPLRPLLWAQRSLQP